MGKIFEHDEVLNKAETAVSVWRLLQVLKDLEMYVSAENIW